MKLTKFNERFKTKMDVMSLEDFLDLAKKDPACYRSAHERLLHAIGEPVLVDTAKDSKLGTIFEKRVIKTYPVFNDFYGMEEVIENIVSYFKHAAQGLEEKKQVLYLLGPVGSAKSSIAERIKELMEKEPFYTLAVETETGLKISPVFESPLGLFLPENAEELNIPAHKLTGLLSPWAVKRIKEFNEDITKFKVVKMFPNKIYQQAIKKVEPGDENNQDISTLVGKIDLRKLEMFSQNDPDAYSFSGGLCRGNRGVMEFVEMFKAPRQVLHPLLTATQEGNYNPSEDGIGAVPFDGIILAHSNESEWDTFKNNRDNEAFLDRICIVDVPYCTRYSEEIKIYKKLLGHSHLKDAPCAPATLDILSKFCVATRLEYDDVNELWRKMLIYNGDNIKDQYKDIKSCFEYKEQHLKEAFKGTSTRQAFKIISKVFNFDSEEVSANPVHMLAVIDKYINTGVFKEDTEAYKSIAEALESKFFETIGKQIRLCLMDSYHEYAQTLFNQYITYADAFIEEQDYRDPDTQEMYNREALNAELEEIEKIAGIVNVKDFRHEVVNFVLRYRSSHKGENPNWREYKKLAEAIEKKLFKETESLIPALSSDLNEKNKEWGKFVKNMEKKGYTPRQTKILYAWYNRKKVNS
jgi:serine protein kinase